MFELQEEPFERLALVLVELARRCAEPSGINEARPGKRELGAADKEI